MLSSSSLKDLAPTDRREAILEAALTLFARYGYAQTSVRRIAQTAGVSQGLMYNYFDGKAGLLRALFEQGLADVEAALKEAAGSHLAAERLAPLVRKSFTLIRRRRRFWKLFYGLRMQEAVLDELGADAEHWALRIREVLEGHFRAVGSAQPETDARLLFAFIDGAAQHYVLEGRTYPIEAVADRLLTLFDRLRDADP